MRVLTLIKCTLLLSSIIGLVFIGGCKPKKKKKPTPFELGKAELHGHRGCRGLYPENSLPGFIAAINFGVDVLEMDVCITKDKKVVLSHEPYFNPEICKADSAVNIYKLNYNEIKKIDCGSLGNPKFPEQQKIPVYKPLLSEVIDSVERYCKRNNLGLPKYNIELKSDPTQYNISQPEPNEFVRLVHQTINGTGIYIRTYIQSFDPAILRAYKKIHPLVNKALLVENNLGLLANIRKAGIMPAIYSPYYEMVTQSLIDSCHLMGLKIIPWTVNEPAIAQDLLDMGVDGIITDYPNRMLFIHQK